MAAEQFYLEYSEQLTHDSEAWGWLLKRGLVKRTIRSHQLGYVEKPLPGHEQYRGRICIPYFDALGRQTQAQFRRIDNEEKYKFINLKGTPMGLYSIQDTNSDHVYIVEGPFDAMILHQLGFAAVAIPGSNAWRRVFRFLFRDCELVSIVPDGDKVGDKLAIEVARDLDSVGIEHRFVELPGAKDVNDLYLKDKDALRGLLT